MQEIYKRKLSFSESNRHYIYITKKFRETFPAPGEPITLIIDNQRFEAKVGSLNRIFAADFWDKLPSFKEGDMLIFSMKPDRTFNLTVTRA